MDTTRARATLRVTSLLIFSVFVTVMEVGAQAGPAADHHLDVSLRSGPPGTPVTLSATDLYPEESYRIAIGATAFGFEELEWVMTDANGELSVDVVIPEWGRNDLIHRFILNDLYQKPVGFSGLFHVTDADGNVRREGTIADVAGRGLELIGVDGITYALAGDLTGFAEGAEVVVEGSVVDHCDCGGMITIRVR